ncbi:BnaC03g48320D [Brassica napus]|uniref:BnaA09g07710D protein n=1 Tax=Brassica napus TaxID=3708 RepID=A0A078FZL8_BRANA|nr:BnaA09g07710D [Brassica napus]CDY36473.1 BnaC03g48320D [Brassica napus]
MDRQWWRVLSDSASFSPFVSGFRCIRWFPRLYLGALGGEAIRLARSSQISSFPEGQVWRRQSPGLLFERRHRRVEVFSRAVGGASVWFGSTLVL